MKYLFLFLLGLLCSCHINAQSLIGKQPPKIAIHFYANEYQGFESAGSGSLIELGNLEFYIDQTNPAEFEVQNTTCMDIFFSITGYFVSPEREEFINYNLSEDMYFFDEDGYLDLVNTKVKSWKSSGWLSSNLYRSSISKRSDIESPTMKIQNFLRVSDKSHEYFFSEVKVGLNNPKEVYQDNSIQYYLTEDELLALIKNQSFIQCMGYPSSDEFTGYLDMHFKNSKFLSQMDEKVLRRIAVFPKELIEKDTNDLNSLGVAYIEGKYQAKYYFDAIYTMDAIPPILREIAKSQSKPLVFILEDDDLFVHPSRYLNELSDSEKEFIRNEWILAQLLPTKANLDWLKQFSIDIDSGSALIIINQYGKGATQRSSNPSDLIKMIQSLIEAQR